MRKTIKNFDMQYIEFISRNWSQITVFLAALGYLLKIVLDFNIRKREIKFEYLYKEKAIAFQHFLLCYLNFMPILLECTWRYKCEEISFQCYKRIVDAHADKLDNKIDLLLMYCSVDEISQLYTVLQDCRMVPHQVKYVNEKMAEQIANAYHIRTLTIVEKLRRNFSI